jgi:hypothetical protein
LTDYPDRTAEELEEELQRLSNLYAKDFELLVTNYFSHFLYALSDSPFFLCLRFLRSLFCFSIFLLSYIICHCLLVSSKFPFSFLLLSLFFIFLLYLSPMFHLRICLSFFSLSGISQSLYCSLYIYPDVTSMTIFNFANVPFIHATIGVLKGLNIFSPFLIISLLLLHLKVEYGK